MSASSWLLAFVLASVIVRLVFYMTEWSFKTECFRTRQRRTMVTVLLSVFLTMLALWAVLLP